MLERPVLIMLLFPLLVPAELAGEDWPKGSPALALWRLAEGAQFSFVLSLYVVIE